MKRLVSLFTAMCMMLMLFDTGILTVSADDTASHIHDMSVSCGGSGIEFQPYPGGSTGPGSYYLTENVSHTTKWDVTGPGVYNLCLNGYSINPTCIFIHENATFNLCDCKGSGSITSFDKTNINDGVTAIVHGEFNMYGGTLNGAVNSDVDDLGVLIDNDNGRFTMHSGEITGVHAEATGGVVVLKGSFIMNGGKIINNTVHDSAAGAGVTACGSTSSVTINGGEISDNNGGFGVAVRDGARLEINGGRIEGNSGGGVNCGTEAPYFSGSPVIKNNYNNGEKYNLLLSRLYINGKLDKGAEIGIAGCDNYIFTHNWKETMGDADPADYFTSDSDITRVKRYSDEGALCVLLTLDTGDLTGITGDIPGPTYYPKGTEVELPKNLKLKGHIFGGWSKTPNGPSENSSIVLESDTTLYPVFNTCKHDNKANIFRVEPTCTRPGFEAYAQCNNCGMTFASIDSNEPYDPKTLPALGHDFDDWTTVNEATCTTDGTKEHVCQRSGCGKKETDIIPKTGHTFGTDYENDDDQHWQICTECNGESEKSDHNWDEGKVTKPSTETEEGEMTYKCTVCSATKTESIDKIHTHTYSPAWSSNETHHWHASTCGHTEAVDGKEEHIFVDGKCKVCQRPDPNYETPTDTSVSETQPPETDPSDTESSDTQPPETDPSDTESSDTQPPETDLSDTESSDTQPPETDPSDTESSDTQPPETDPSDTESSDTQPPVTDPSDTGSSDTQPPVTDPNDTESSVTNPPVTEPPATQPTSTNPPYIPSYPSSGSPAPAVPASSEPFLPDENGRSGWDVISDNIWAAPDGETVRVNMNGTTKLPKNIVSDIAGRDVNLVLIMNKNFTWTINGMSVTKAKTVDMNVRKISKIPKSVVQDFFGGTKTVQFDLRHNGDFGFTAELTVDIGEKYSGLYANSYCYRSRNFEFGDSAEIMNGQAKLRFTHASSWLITVEDSPAVEDVSSASAAHSAGTPIDMSNSASGVPFPEFDEKRGLKLSGGKRRYRVLKKRRLDDMVFVL